MFGEETTVGLPTGSGAHHSDSAVAKDGTYIVASTIFAPGTTKLVASRYTAHGLTIGSQVTLLSLPDNPVAGLPRLNEVSIATDADADSVIAYSIFNLNDTTESINFIRVSRTGAVSSPRFLTQGEARNPEVTMSNDGTFFIGWTTSNLLDSFVRVAAFNAAGNRYRPTPSKDDRRCLREIRGYHVDFVVCDRETTQPFVVIELDDTSHLRFLAQNRDQFNERRPRCSGQGCQQIEEPEREANNLSGIDQFALHAASQFCLRVLP